MVQELWALPAGLGGSLRLCLAHGDAKRFTRPTPHGHCVQPPKHWLRADPESKELLTFCIKRVKGMQKVRAGGPRQRTSLRRRRCRLGKHPAAATGPLRRRRSSWWTPASSGLSRTRCALRPS